MLLLHGLGGTNIPEILLTSVRDPQRRWNAEGEIENTSAIDFGLPAELVDLFSDDTKLAQAMASPYFTRTALDGGIIAWSLHPEVQSSLTHSLLPQTSNELLATALKVICFACPPCYDGNTHWYD